MEHQESDADFITDRFQLELEAEKQPPLVMHYGRQLALWKAKEKEEKRKLELTLVECAEVIRNVPHMYGITKDTDAVVFKLAQGEPEYIKQHEAWNHASQMADTYDLAVRSLLQKGSMIKELVKLWLNDYYSTPVVREGEIRPRKPRDEESTQSLMEKLKQLKTQHHLVNEGDPLM